MDADKLFMKMKDPSHRSYKIKRVFYTAGRAFVTYIVFPLVICATLAGGAFFAADSLTADGNSKSGIFYKFSKAKTSDKSRMPVAEENCEEIKENNGDILQRLYEFDSAAVPDGYVGIVPVSLYRKSDDGYVFVSDAGDKKQIDAEPYLNGPLAVTYKKSEDYQVLIIHTHGTEAFSPDGAIYTEPGSYPRSKVKEENVVCLGDIFEETFNAAGIKTLHCEIPIDKESYSKAYSNAAKIIKEYLNKYPTIKYMFDIHRDAVELSDGSKARMVTAVNGQTAAQLMFVVGSDRLVSENENWRDNLALAVKLQTALDAKYPGLMRPINIKQGAFNQFYTPLSILIEVGSDGNSLQEAKRSAKILAEQMVKTIKES